MLSADFARLADEIAAAERGGARLLHLDVMDGRFVPNLTIGVPVVRSVRRVTRLPLDVHLMIQEPDRFVERFARAGADMISFHQEAVSHVHRTIHYIRECGVAAGVALNPATPLTMIEEVLEDLDFVLLMSVNPGFGGQRFIPSVMSKVAALRRAIDETGSAAMIEVDGGISPDNLVSLRRSGADIFVAGSAVFGGRDPRRRVRSMVARLESAGGRG
ncbi:MAG: ribulose-phosphate 3-epimerase [Acidobacteriota bacterium]